MHMPMVICECPKTASKIVDDAERLAELTDAAVLKVTGCENAMKIPYHGKSPRCVIGRLSSNPFDVWCLECNDPDISRDDLALIRNIIRETYKSA